MSPTAPQAAWKPATPAEVAELQKRFTGLDDKLHYKEGHTIHRDHIGYKAAQETAKAAIATYKNTAKTLPHAEDRSLKVLGRNFTPQGHRTMAPLAGTVSQTSQEWVLSLLPWSCFLVA